MAHINFGSHDIIQVPWGHSATTFKHGTYADSQIFFELWNNWNHLIQFNVSERFDLKDQISWIWRSFQSFAFIVNLYSQLLVFKIHLEIYWFLTGRNLKKLKLSNFKNKAVFTLISLTSLCYSIYKNKGYSHLLSSSLLKKWLTSQSIILFLL